MNDKIRIRKCLNALIILTMVFTMMVPMSLPANAATPKFEASAKVKAKKGAVIRKTAADKGKALKKVKRNSKLIVYKEVFTSKKDTKAVHRWYYVASGKTKGYIRSDKIKITKYRYNKAKTTDYLYYRVGVGRKMKRKGMFKKGAAVTVVHPAYQKGSKEKWYKVKVGKKYYYSCATWIKFTNVSTKKKTNNTSAENSSGNSSSSGSTSTNPTSVETKGAYTGKFPTLRLKKTNAQAIADGVVWAKWIAADNRFHYGYGKHAHHNGCYFCGTQYQKKNKGINLYNYSYCCNPFVGAFWAHGAGDATALRMCRDCDSWDFGTGKGSYHKSKLFDNLGHPAKSKLKVGDVLCCGYHAAVYIGNGMIAESSGGDDNVVGSSKWNNSTRITKLTDSRYKDFPRAYRYKGSVDVDRNIEEGEVSARVRDLKKFLNWYGYNLEVNKVFNENTTKAVVSFQKANGLVPDGIVGELTIAKMKEVKK